MRRDRRRLRLWSDDQASALLQVDAGGDQRDTIPSVDVEGRLGELHNRASNLPDRPATRRANACPSCRATLELAAIELMIQCLAPLDEHPGFAAGDVEVVCAHEVVLLVHSSTNVPEGA